jgi:tripartite-type tricarboxylate transporter receptor subunit TctC
LNGDFDAPICAVALVRLGNQRACSPHPIAVNAQSYPSRPVHVVVAFSAGGTTDVLARSVGQQLAERLKQPFIIDNKAGAGGNIGTEFVVRSPPDGYTLIVDSVGPIAVNPTLYKTLGYDPLTDLVPIVQIADVPNVLVVHPSLGVKNLADFIAYAKANPGKLYYGSTVSEHRRIFPASCWLSVPMWT